MEDPPSPRLAIPVTGREPENGSEPVERASAPSLFDQFSAWLRGRLSGSRPAHEATLLETVEEVLEEHGEDDQVLGVEERSMLANLLKFGDLRVSDVMVPRSEIAAVEAGSSLADLVAAFREHMHSRLPVYRETLDDIAGMIHIKDLLAARPEPGRAPSVPGLMRTVLFVPPSMRLLDLLVRMRSTRVHMALVIDEYGGTDGLLTIEDLVEQIIGEIEDEHDVEEEQLLKLQLDGSIEADGKALIADLEEMSGLSDLADEEAEFETVGGLAAALFGRVPLAGERVLHPAGLEFVVTEANPRRILKMLITHNFSEAAAKAQDDTV